MSKCSLQETINELMGLYGQARFSEMEARARPALDAFPRSAVLCELLGMALGGQRRYSEAAVFLERATRIDPNDTQFWENLAFCQCQLRQFAPAEASLRRSLELRPGAIHSMAALGGVLLALGRSAEARVVLEHAVGIAPAHAGAHIHLARVLAGEGRLSEAERHLREAIAIDVNHAGAHCELGIVLRRMENWTDAEASLRRALALDRSRFVAHANLAWLMSRQNRHDEAVKAAHAGLEGVGDLATLVPAEEVGSLDLIAESLDAAGRGSEAIAIYRVALKLKAEPARALAAIHAARRACDWTYAASLEALACRVGEDGEGQGEAGDPGILLLLAQATPAGQLVAARRYAQRLARAAPSLIPRPKAPASGAGRIRIGYLSSDFYNHATAHLIAGVIEAHDRKRFEVVAYDFSPASDDEYRRRLQGAFDALVPLGSLSDQGAAQRIADDGADIVIDLKGWTRGHRGAILAARPAPVQVQWLGYPGTLGAPWIDYVIADAVIAPPGCETDFSEKIIRLPGCYQPNDDRRRVDPPLDRQACGLPQTALVLCSFNQIVKVSADVFASWLRILQAVDRSVLWLSRPEEAAAQALLREAQSRGVDVGRIIFAPTLKSSEHRARIGVADLALDCFPYGSHTTASDMLWAGVPLVALKGDTFASRVSASVLETAGLADLITDSPEEYFRLCLRLATDADALLHMKLRAQTARKSPLFDTAKFTRDLERAYDLIWTRHWAGAAPDHGNIN